jgi:nucleolar protein 15
VTQIRLSRNKKTGASKHFAFIEFAEASTAEIVAKTMDNYLLFGHILKCKVLPKEQAHDDIFKGANKRFKKVPWNKIAGKNLEKPLSESSWKKKVTKEQNKRNKSAEVLKKIGYTFEAPAIQAIPPPALKLEDAESKAIEAAPEEEAEAPAAEKIVEDAPEEEKPKSISAPKTRVTKPKAKKAAKGKKAKA